VGGGTHRLTLLWQVQFQQLTPAARSGVTVFSMNYPLTTPFSNRFPTAVVSALRALAFLKERGFTSVTIVGESAGGQIGSLVAAYLHNPLLLTRLGREVSEPIARPPQGSPGVTHTARDSRVQNARGWGRN
jgi:acetyl esterase/lipase